MSKIIKNNISYAGAEDNKVKQNETSTNASYEVLLSGTADNTTRSEEARKSEKLAFNPDEGGLAVDGNITVNSDANVSALTVFGSYTDTRPAFTVSPDDEGGASVHLFKSDMPAVFINAHNHTADPNDSEDEDRIGGEIGLNGTSGFDTVNLDGQTGTITVSNPSNATPTITLNGANGGITATSLNGSVIGASPAFTDNKVTQTDMSDVSLGGEHCLVFAGSNDTPTKTEGLGKTKYIQCIGGPTYELSGLVFRDNNNDAKMTLYADGILTNQQVWTKRVMADASGQGTSYVNPDHKAAVYVEKDYQTNQWFPFAMTQTYNGGQWSIGTYNSEELLFVYTTKYNVDHNVNTNQIWKLQLNKNDNSGADNRIITSDCFTGTNAVTTNTLSEIFVRSSGGTAIEAAFRRWGRVCTLYLHFKTTATTSGGGNMIVGKAGSKVTPYLPPMTVTGGSYYSSMALGGHLASDGSITVRNASSSNIGAQSSGFRMTWTWVY